VNKFVFVAHAASSGSHAELIEGGGVLVDGHDSSRGGTIANSPLTPAPMDTNVLSSNHRMTSGYAS